MKRLYISDVVHEHLKREAVREGRTLQWVVEERLTRESPPSVYNISTDEVSSDVRPDVQGAFVPRPPDPETGYPCCEKSTPCKHWQWDSSLAGWVNSLTGKTRND